jgi:hypothetical protein
MECETASGRLGSTIDSLQLDQDWSISNRHCELSTIRCNLPKLFPFLRFFVSEPLRLNMSKSVKCRISVFPATKKRNQNDNLIAYTQIPDSADRAYCGRWVLREAGLP